MQDVRHAAKLRYHFQAFIRLGVAKLLEAESREPNGFGGGGKGEGVDNSKNATELVDLEVLLTLAHVVSDPHDGFVDELAQVLLFDDYLLEELDQLTLTQHLESCLLRVPCEIA